MSRERDRILRWYGQLQAVDEIRKPVAVDNPSDLQLSRACFVSAVYHYHSGVLLARSRAYGPGVAHLILGIEEMGKGLVYRWLSLGVFTSNPVEKGVKPYVERAVLECHQCKQRLVYLSTVGMDLLPEIAGGRDLDADFERVWNDPTAKLDWDIPSSNEEIARRVENGLRPNPDRAKSIALTLLEPGILERLKWIGLYVDDNGGKRLSAPWYVTKKVFIEMRRRFLQLSETVLPFLHPGAPREMDEALKRILPRMTFPVTIAECEHQAGKRYRKGRGSR